MSGVPHKPMVATATIWLAGVFLTFHEGELARLYIMDMDSMILPEDPRLQ